MKKEEKIKFEESEELNTIGEDLLRSVNLSGIKVKFLLVSGRNIRYYGKVIKTSSLMKFLTDLDLVVLINKDAWSVFNQTQKEALVLHELLHVGRNERDEITVTKEHDVEEFVKVVERYGSWTPALSLMEKAFSEREEKKK
jgi:hypothetical protein